MQDSLGSTSDFSVQLLSQWALRRSFPRMESLMLQNCAGVACRSWSPLLPTDTAQTWPCSRVALWNMSCHQVPAPSVCIRE